METANEQRPRTRDRAARGMILALQRIVDVRDREVHALLWSCVYFFSLLAGNYVIRPVRDEMGIAGGTRYLPWMFAGTLAAMLLANPLFAALVGRHSRQRLIPRVYRILQVQLLLFFALPRVGPASGMAAIARGFFIWASVYNLFVVSVVWGFLADRFNSDQAKRLFGFIGAGGTLGAIVGSGLAAALAPHIGPLNLLLLAVLFLELGTLAVRRLLPPAGPSSESGFLADSDLTRRETDDPAEQPGGVLSGIRRAFGSPYLLGLSLYMLLFTTSSAFVYLEQARIVDATFREPADRTAFFARIDLLVNAFGLAVQTLLTGRIIAALGVGVTAAILPALTLAGFVALALRPALTTLLWFQVIRRAADYAVARPSREVMFTVLRRDDKYKAKTFIDTAIYRMGDALGAWAYGLLAVLPGLAQAITLLMIPLTILWMFLSLLLGRQQQRLAERQAVLARGGRDRSA